MLCSGRGARAHRRSRSLFALRSFASAAAAVAAFATAAGAQTIVLNVQDSQVVDTTIRNGPYATYNHNSATLVTRSSTVPDWERRAILSFNASSVPSGTLVRSATLTLTLKSGLGSAGAQRTVAVRRLGSAFVESQATWLVRQTGTPWAVAGGDVAETVTTSEVTNTANTKITFNVTAVVQQAVNGSYSRQVRLALIDIDGGGDAKESFREYHSSEASTASNRPQLAVSYGSASTTTIDVPAGGSLQTALDQVAPGGTVRLAPGATYVGNYVLPAKGSTSYVTITTARSSPDDDTFPPENVRIDPSYKPRLATLRSPNNTAALRTSAGASYFKIVGIAFEANANGDGDVITLGASAQTTLSSVPHHIELDRVLILGDPAIGQRRGVSVQAAHVSILNSDIRDIKDVGYDSQAIAGWNTPGPVVIRNNFLEAAGENILFGGADPKIANLVPSDIVIEGNLLTKDTLWRSTSWTVKNLLELKNARRVLVRGNILENIWASGQNGFAVQLTPRNQEGNAPWSTVEDVEFSGNVFRHAGAVFNISGHDDIHRSGQLARLLIRNNVAYDIHHGTWGGNGVFAQIGNEPRDITIDHNTILHTGNIITFYSGRYLNSSGASVAGGPIYGFSYTNNLAKHNAYGIFGSGKSIGLGSLNYYAPGAVVTHNVFATDTSRASLYPAGNFFPTVAAFYAGFVNASARDYRLSGSSPYVGAGSDGADIGAAIPD
jgi:hypothetical protein